jgi:hypothetical protein
LADHEERPPAGHTNSKELTMSMDQDAQDNMKYQRWLAESLVASLGYDKAVKVCREMCWDGTLDFFMKARNGRVAAIFCQPTTLIEAA